MAHLGAMTLPYVTKIMVDFETLPTDRIMRVEIYKLYCTRRFSCTIIK